jgi:HEAT repeat-containing protein 5
MNRFLSILKHAQQRESEAAVPCEKNTLLATTVLLSSATSTLDPGDPLIKRFIDTLADCLGNRLTSRVAANCVRSLLLLPKKNTNNTATAVEAAYASHLLPHIFAFLTHPSDIETLDETRSLLTQTLVGFVGTLPSSAQKSSAIALVLPTMLARAQKEGEETYKETAGRVLELASIAQTEFKAVVGGLNGEQRAFMEEVIRSGGPGTKGRGGQNEGDRGRSGEPRIALRMDFGS